MPRPTRAATPPRTRTRPGRRPWARSRASGRRASTSSRAPDSETKVTRSSPIQSQTQAASPSRYAGVASRDADDAPAAAEAAAAAAARAETPPPREDLVSREELVSRHDSSPSRPLARLGRSPRRSAWAAIRACVRSFGEKPFADDHRRRDGGGRARRRARRRGDFHDFDLRDEVIVEMRDERDGPRPRRVRRRSV